MRPIIRVRKKADKIVCIATNIEVDLILGDVDAKTTKKVSRKIQEILNLALDINAIVNIEENSQ